jgi:hypothetical protein
MSLEHELVESSLVLANMREHIKEMEQLILDWNTLMQSYFPYTWNNGEGLLLQERMKELGIVAKEK